MHPRTSGHSLVVGDNLISPGFKRPNEKKKTPGDDQGLSVEVGCAEAKAGCSFLPHRR